jgi:hypothetical protein
MHFHQRAHHRPKFRAGAAAAAGVLALSLAGYAAPAAASAAVSSRAGVQPPGAVEPKPAAGTPELVPDTGSTLDSIQQMVQCGSTMFAVGSFSQISQNGTTYSRSNVFSFDASSPYTITSWAPQVNGTVNSITFNGGNCADAYIGGNFTSVNGTKVEDIAEIDTTAGNVVSTFGHTTAGGQVETLLGVDGHILVGGYFTSINGSSSDPYMASVSPVTGQDDGFLHLKISGYYHYCSSPGGCTTGKTSSVKNQQLSHNGDYDLVEGDFTSVGGLPRQQIFMLNLTTDPASVTAWTSPQWDGSNSSEPYRCMPVEAFYIRSAAWSPDDSTVYIADTGFHPAGGSTGKTPRTGLCDAAAAFPATLGQVTDKWIEYTGCDSYYSVAADDGAVYVAGHPRWAENSDDCNAAGAGAIKDYGLQGLNPSTGGVELRGTGTTPVYTMSRANADNMLITSAGLWISSTNRFGSQSCQQVSGHSGICMLPYPSS